MSREIRFRGWDTRQKVMYSAEEMGQDQLTLSVDGRGFINVSGRSTKLSTFATHIIPMQYIGLKDKNGVDLDWWEDDLLRKGSDHPNAPITIIAYREQDARWSIVSKSGNEFCSLAEAYRCGWKKVGNRHQHPKLLEGK